MFGWFIGYKGDGNCDRRIKVLTSSVREKGVQITSKSVNVRSDDGNGGSRSMRFDKWQIEKKGKERKKSHVVVKVSS